MARIFQINISTGGLPKSGIPRVMITAAGAQGDQQRDLVHHGGPNRALCLYALELIQALQAEGHPVFPGAMGENLTLTGLDWSLVVPGSRLQLGSQALIEVTSFTIPCNHLIPFFAEGEIDRVGQKHHPGWSRLYARVVQEGPIQVGDSVVLLT